MGNLLIKGIVVISIILLQGASYAAEPETLSDAELGAVSAGMFFDFDMLEEMLGEMLGEMMVLAETGTLANINAVNSATEVQSNFHCNEIGLGEVVNTNTANVVNEVSGSTNTLTISDSAQASLVALVNINAVGSATVVQSNFNFNVDSAYNTNIATVINSH